jgi:antitoxin VapB
MGLSIKNLQAEEDARALSRVTGESVTKAIAVAVHERLQRLTRQQTAEERLRHIQEIALDTASRWPEHLRNVNYDELLYNEKGVPR